MIEGRPTLTLRVLQSKKAHRIIDTGFYDGGPEGLGVNDEPEEVRWTCVTGEVGDWAVYVGPKAWNPWMAAKHGKKLYDMDKIKLVVPCDEAAARRCRA